MTSPSTDVLPTPGVKPDPKVRFAHFAWGVLAYTIAVILFGAIVRITGSGAGCGQHWPTCQGEIVHLPRSTATAIEYTHRLTSGLSLVLVIALGVTAMRTFPRRHQARRAAAATVAFMLSESLVGAALVLLALVGHNTSVARAAVMAVHLVNTSFLTGAMAMTAWTATRAVPRRHRPRTDLDWALAGALFATLLVSVTGAVTALGDTLYPVQAGGSLAERMAADHSAVATFLERGRAIHPLVAFLGATTLLGVSRKAAEAVRSEEVARASLAVQVLVFAQVAAGVLNIVLSAPGYMQVVHLALATSVWIALVLLHATCQATTGDHAPSELAAPAIRH